MLILIRVSAAITRHYQAVIQVKSLPDRGKYHTTGSYPSNDQIFYALCPKYHIEFSKRESSHSAFNNDDLIFCGSNTFMNRRFFTIVYKNSIGFNCRENSVVLADLRITIAEPDTDIDNCYTCSPCS